MRPWPDGTGPADAHTYAKVKKEVCRALDERMGLGLDDLHDGLGCPAWCCGLRRHPPRAALAARAEDMTLAVREHPRPEQKMYLDPAQVLNLVCGHGRIPPRGL